MREALLVLTILCLVVLVGMTPRGALLLAVYAASFACAVALGARWHRGIWAWPTYVCAALLVGDLMFDPLHVRGLGIVSMLVPFCGWVFGIARHPARRNAVGGV